MRVDCSAALVVVHLLAIVGPASAQFNSPTLLYQTPTARVLPVSALAISADLTYPLTKTSMNVDYPEVDVNVRFSPLKHLDFAVTAYTFTDYALDAKYQIFGSRPDRFGLAVGVYDIGLNNLVSPIGHGTAKAWPDWKWPYRPAECFSLFAVTSIPVTEFARLHVGLGRGRFVGYSTLNKYLNTDALLGGHHQWAVGLFGGAELYITPEVALAAEASGRDLNTGVRVCFGLLTATVAWTKMEGLILAAGEPDGTAKFGRLEVGVSCQIDRARQYRKPEVLRPFVEPVPEPDERPVVPATLEKLRLYAILFDWDKWEITPAASATLHRNADVLLANPNVHVVITGYTYGEGTNEYNLRLSGLRARTAYEYLKLLGVPEQQMRYRALGESAGKSYPIHRSVYFEIEPED